MKKYTTILLFVTALLLASQLPGRYSAASEKKPTLTPKIQQLEAGKSCRFSLKNFPRRKKNKGCKITYTVSNRRIAAIGRKSGKCRGKKPGRVTIYAKIYNRRGRKIQTLKRTLKIIRSSLLPHASFQMTQSINPYNYTVKIGCSRILLKKEVRKSKLTLLKKGSKNPLSASFTALSSNGRELTYTLTGRSQKKLCPGNGTMNGTYTLSSPLFRKKLSLKYQERIGNYALSGYVFSVEGSPVNQAYIKCMTKSSTKACRTDSRGYYRLTGIKNPVSLTVSKSGYLTKKLTEINTSAKATRCESFVLHQTHQSSFSAQFHVTEQGGAAIPDASVYLLQEGRTITGKTDGQGKLLFYTNSIPAASPCTKWTLGQQKLLTCENSFSPDSRQNKKISPISIDKPCTLLVGKKAQANAPGYRFYQFAFCPADYHTKQFCFDIRLSGSGYLSLKDLTLKCGDMEEALCTQLQLSLYQKGYAKPIYQSNLARDRFSIKNHIIHFDQKLSYALPEDTYYLKIEIKDKTGNILSYLPMTSLSIKNGEYPGKTLSCVLPSYSRLLAYGDFTAAASASFECYQLIEGQYYYLDTLSTSLFQGSRWDTKTASLIVSGTEAEHSYLLMPVKGKITGKSSVKFTIRENAVFSDQQTAEAAPPLAKLPCIAALEEYTPQLPPELMEQSELPAAAVKASATQAYVRSCPSYPNSVTVFYKKEGTFLSASLTSAPAQSIDILKNNRTIIDIYTNGRNLLTTQNYYHFQ